eukprot:Pgem_evm1s5351
MFSFYKVFIFIAFLLLINTSLTMTLPVENHVENDANNDVKTDEILISDDNKEFESETNSDITTQKCIKNGKMCSSFSSCCSDLCMAGVCAKS